MRFTSPHEIFLLLDPTQIPIKKIGSTCYELRQLLFYEVCRSISKLYFTRLFHETPKINLDHVVCANQKWVLDMQQIHLQRLFFSTHGLNGSVPQSSKTSNLKLRIETHNHNNWHVLKASTTAPHTYVSKRENQNTIEIGQPLHSTSMCVCITKQMGKNTIILFLYSEASRKKGIWRLSWSRHHVVFSILELSVTSPSVSPPRSSAFAPYPLFQRYPQSMEILLNLGMKC